MQPHYLSKDFLPILKNILPLFLQFLHICYCSCIIYYIHIVCCSYQQIYIVIFKRKYVFSFVIFLLLQDVFVINLIMSFTVWLDWMTGLCATYFCHVSNNYVYSTVCPSTQKKKKKYSLNTWHCTVLVRTL